MDRLRRLHEGLRGRHSVLHSQPQWASASSGSYARRAIGARQREPLPVALRREHREDAAHLVVVRAAVLGARDLELARRRAPANVSFVIVPGHRVPLHAEVRQVEAVDHVHRGELDEHRRAHRDADVVQRHDVVGRVELAVRPGVARRPRPLVRLHLDPHGVRPLLRGREVPEEPLHVDDACGRTGTRPPRRRRAPTKPSDAPPIDALLPWSWTAAVPAPVADERDEEHRADDDEDDGRRDGRELDEPVDPVAVHRRVAREAVAAPAAGAAAAARAPARTATAASSARRLTARPPAARMARIDQRGDDVRRGDHPADEQRGVRARSPARTPGRRRASAGASGARRGEHGLHRTDLRAASAMRMRP